MIRPLSIALFAASATFQAYATDGVLDVVAPFELKGKDPISSGSILLKMDVTETLVDAEPDGTLIPGLATGWQVSDDGLTWTFKLRENVVFHDGSALTGESVASSLEWSRNNGGLLAKTPINSISGEGHTVTIQLSERFAILPAMLVEYRSAIIAPSSIIDGKVTNVVGTGAYRALEFLPPNKMVVETFDNYWGDRAKIEQAVYHGISRAETRALMAESGDADLTLGLDPASFTRLQTKDDLKLASAAIPRVLMLKINGEVFDKATRNALSKAIDREGIARAVLRYDTGATQMFPPGMAAWHDESLEPLAYDPDLAQKELADAGWTLNSEGVLERAGQTMEIEILTYPDRPELPLVAAVLEQQFATVGAATVINSTNYTEIPAKHNSGELSTALFARNFALVPDPVGTLLQDYAPGGDWGAMGWNNSEFTAGVNALAAGTAQEGTRDYLVSTLHTELPVIPIAWYQLNMAITNNISGVVVDPFERTLGLAGISWVNP